MSIIEKAVDKLEKKATAQPEADDSAIVDEAPVEPFEQVKQDQVAPEAEETAALPVADDATVEKIEAEPEIKSEEKSDNPSVELPVAKINALGMVSPDLPRSKIAEEYRVIKRPLLMNIRGEGAVEVENANLVLVSSALAGEGKTFSAINLAMSIAMEQDKTVLFVDADVSKATATHFFGIPDNQKGLIDILQNSHVSVGDVILNTNIPNLRILPAGHAHDRPTELLASDNMRSMMMELSSRYSDRVIIFDSPPLLQTTEAAVLANLVGQVVLVVAANDTPQAAVTEAIEHIRDDKVIGMVLNKADIKDNSQFGYGYGYGYGYGGRERAED